MSALLGYLALLPYQCSGDKTWIAFCLGRATSSGLTVYSGLKYTLSISFPDEYPCVAPTVKFVTPCFHPNVDQHGNICLDILKEAWSAVYDAGSILRSIQSLLGEPNNDSPLNTHAAGLWADQAAYEAHLLRQYDQDVTNADPATAKK